MNMNVVWRKRATEREILLEKLKVGIISRRVESQNPPLEEELRMCKVYMEFFAFTERLSIGSIVVDEGYRAFFHKEILGPIRAFSHSEMEALSLIAELYAWEARTIAEHFKGTLCTT